MGDDRMPPAKIRNLQELARLAGVSPGTASRALAGKTLVNPRTRERIQKIAREHGYRVNQLARRLRVKQTNIVGVVLPVEVEKASPLFDAPFTPLLCQLIDELSEINYEVIVHRALTNTEDWLDRIVDSGMLDGLIVVGANNQFDHLERVARSYRPMVVVGGYVDGQRHCSVDLGCRPAGALAAERLLATGRKNLALVSERGAFGQAEHFQGLCDALSSRGLRSPERIHVGPGRDASGLEIGSYIRALDGRVDGIVCGSSPVAMGVLRSLMDCSVGVPSEVSVVGLDQAAWANQAIPRLTTVGVDIAECATSIVRLLLERIAGNDCVSLRLNPQITVRESA